MFGHGSKERIAKLELQIANLNNANQTLKEQQRTERDAQQRMLRASQRDNEAVAAALEEAWPLRQREQVRKLVSLVSAQLQSPGHVMHLPRETVDPLLRQVLKELEDDA